MHNSVIFFIRDVVELQEKKEMVFNATIQRLMLSLFDAHFVLSMQNCTCTDTDAGMSADNTRNPAGLRLL